MIKESELTPENSGFQPKTLIFPYLSGDLEDKGEVGAEASSASYNTVSKPLSRCGLTKLLLRMFYPAHACFWGLTGKLWEG